MALIVLIDGDPLQARLITDNLGTLGHIVQRATGSWDGLILAHRIRPDLIMVDCGIAQWSEFLTLARTMRGLSRTPILLIASRCPPQYFLRKLAVAGCIAKHFDAAVLVQQVEHLLLQPHVALLADEEPAARATEDWRASELNTDAFSS